MNFLWILLFGSFVSITELPVNLIEGTNEVPLRKPISAVTSGATLQVDVSTMIPGAELTLDLSRTWLERNIEPGCLKAVLRGSGTVATELDFKGGLAFEPGKVFLILSSRNGVPVRQEFGSLTLTSCRPLSKVVLYWKNYQK